MALQLASRSALVAARPNSRVASTRSTRRAVRVFAEADKAPVEAAPVVESSSAVESAPEAPAPTPASTAVAFNGEWLSARLKAEKAFGVVREVFGVAPAPPCSHC